MKIIRSLKEFPGDKPVSACIGNFDGIHSGHFDIIKECKSNEGLTTVITFDKHPREFLFPDFAPEKLTLKNEKFSFFSDLGVDLVLELPFSEFYGVKPLKFIDILNEAICLRSVTIGFNFYFGKDQEGTAELLHWWGRSSGVKIAVIPPTIQHGIRVSSTAIRELIVSGNIEKATSFLTFPFVLSGEIIRGRQIGREMNFPTINIDLPEKIIPPDGVYITQTVVAGVQRPSLTNIGRNPTVDDESIQRKIETWVVDEQLDELYGKYASIYFFKKIRNEIRFSSKEKLYAKVHEDREKFYEFWKDREIKALPDTDWENRS